MILKTDNRISLFKQAKALAPLLRDLFQNEMEITPEFVELEIARQHRKDELAKIDSYYYISKLGTLLCFPEKFR